MKVSRDSPEKNLQGKSEYYSSRMNSNFHLQRAKHKFTGLSLRFVLIITIICFLPIGQATYAEMCNGAMPGPVAPPTAYEIECQSYSAWKTVSNSNPIGPVSADTDTGPMTLDLSPIL